MTKLYANAKWIKGLRTDVDDGRSHAVCLDLPHETGTDMGTSALELALMSYAGCYATIFVLTASKSRINLEDLEVKMEATKSEEAGTIEAARLEIEVKADAPSDRVQRVHELTLENCPVGKIFDKAGIKTAYALKTRNRGELSAESK